MKNSPPRPRRSGFTLIELLVVISIIATLAALTFPVLRAVRRSYLLKIARSELAQIELAVDRYKAQYGVYPPGNAADPLLNQLYYELSGTTNNGVEFVTLDGASRLAIQPGNAVKTAFGVDGFVNCSKGGGEDGHAARNFLSGLSAREIYYPVTNNLVPTVMLVTSVGGPDDAYRPLIAPGLNPFRYAYPGTNHPGGYDLWIDLVIYGQTNRLSNW